MPRARSRFLASLRNDNEFSLLLRDKEFGLSLRDEEFGLPVMRMTRDQAPIRAAGEGSSDQTNGISLCGLAAIAGQPLRPALRASFGGRLHIAQYVENALDFIPSELRSTT
jgi:hypothetical protein